MIVLSSEFEYNHYMTTMLNLTPAVKDMIQDAIDLLDDSEKALNDAKATTNPVTQAAKLRAAIEWHEDTIQALKKSVFLYRDGVQKINTRLKFDFYKTVEETDVDLVVLLDKIEPLAVGAFEAIADALQTNFPDESPIMRQKVILELNNLLTPLFGTNAPTWEFRDLGDILALRAEVEECLASGDFIGCVEALEITEIEIARRNWLTGRIRSKVGDTFAPELLTNTQLAQADELLSACGGDDLDCLTTTLANQQSVPAYPNLNIALKRKIIAAVNEIVGFEYDGMYLGMALEVPTPSGNQQWTATAATARDLFLAVPFRYNRVGAANYAIQLSRSNFQSNTFPFGPSTISNGQISPNSPPRSVGSGLLYNTLEHRRDLDSTGSAYFISECLFFGGHLPMYSEDGVAFPCTDATALNRIPPRGWLACCSQTGNQLSATNAWRVHPNLMLYYTNNHNAQPISSPEAILCDYMPSNELCDDTDHEAIGYRDAANTPETYLDRFIRFTPDGNNEAGKWRDGQADAGKEYLYQLFKKGKLANLETGDYVYLAGSHGFLVVGWGDAKDGVEGLNAIAGEDFTLIRPRDSEGNPENTIPYVADFAYGYDAQQMYIGWLQDVRPRPFYTSHARFSATQLSAIRSSLEGENFTFANEGDFQSEYLNRFQSQVYGSFTLLPNNTGGNWAFFHFPDLVHLSFQQIYPLEPVC